MPTQLLDERSVDARSWKFGRSFDKVALEAKLEKRYEQTFDRTTKGDMEDTAAGTLQSLVNTKRLGHAGEECLFE